jgi:hypothetical protein
LLSREGQLFAVVTARAQEYARAHPEAEFAQAKGVILEFCKAVIRMAEGPKTYVGISDSAAQSLAFEIFVRLFADASQIAEFAAHSAPRPQVPSEPL